MSTPATPGTVEVAFPLCGSDGDWGDCRKCGEQVNHEDDSQFVASGICKACQPKSAALSFNLRDFCRFEVEAVIETQCAVSGARTVEVVMHVVGAMPTAWAVYGRYPKTPKENARPHAVDNAGQAVWLADCESYRTAQLFAYFLNGQEQTNAYFF